jgi:hypothetical protein
VLYAAKVEGTADAIERDFEHVHAVISTVEAHVSEVSSCGHARAVKQPEILAAALVLLCRLTLVHSLVFARAGIVVSRGYVMLQQCA